MYVQVSQSHPFDPLTFHSKFNSQMTSPSRFIVFPDRGDSITLSQRKGARPDTRPYYPTLFPLLRSKTSLGRNIHMLIDLCTAARLRTRDRLHQVRKRETYFLSNMYSQHERRTFVRDPVWFNAYWLLNFGLGTIIEISTSTSSRLNSELDLSLSSEPRSDIL